MALLVICAAPLSAEPKIIAAVEAATAAQAETLILVDIRSPGEWAETGVAEGAVALTMHRPDFGQKISALLNANPETPIGLICATGGRTEYVVSVLAENGYRNVIDVSEGMLGNARGEGWIARGLPLVSAQHATKAYDVLVQGR
jgi:rhodanese-related sulfurtransferase